MRNTWSDRRAGSRSVSVLWLTRLVGTMSSWRARAAPCHAKSSPSVPSHGEPVPRCQHHVSCGLRWPGSGGRVGGVELCLLSTLAPLRSSRCAWHLLGLCQGCRRLLVLPQRNLEEVMSKLRVGEGSNRQRWPQVFVGVHALPLLIAGFRPHPCFQLPRLKIQNGLFRLLSW